METHVEKVGDVQVVSLRGRLDLSATPKFQEFLLQLIAQGEHHILLDCKDLKYVSSSGLGTFVAVGKRCGNDGKLVFASLSPNIRQVFELVHFDRFFDIYPDRNEALAQMGASS